MERMDKQSQGANKVNVHKLENGKQPKPSGLILACQSVTPERYEWILFLRENNREKTMNDQEIMEKSSRRDACGVKL